jgi:hypothetical protein
MFKKFKYVICSYSIVSNLREYFIEALQVAVSSRQKEKRERKRMATTETSNNKEKNTMIFLHIIETAPGTEHCNYQSV